jgi:DeoR family fructose operon transcriptional repressor
MLDITGSDIGQQGGRRLADQPARERQRMTMVHDTLAAGERRRWLTERLSAVGSVTLAQAAESLGVSEMTIRRDLDELQARGAARRVRGGAMAIGPQTFAQRRDAAARAKSQIAAKLAELIPVAGAIAFDASSTVMRLCRALTGARDLTVLTNGPETFAALQGLPGVTALLTGGRLDERTGSLVGPLACRAAEQIAVHTFFASAAATRPRFGALEATLEEAEVKRSLAADAHNVVLAVDSSKLDAPGVALGLEWDSIDTFVTELHPGDERLAPYQQLAHVL